jgi:hypothetical protein
VVVHKPGSENVRICVDGRQYNKAIKRENHQMPTAEEFVQAPIGAKLFTKLDLNDAFEQIELDAVSREITTFSTHVGLFRYKRLNLGISSAPEVFHNLIRKVLFDITGQVSCHDDILVFGSDKAELESRVEKVLVRLSESGLTLNGDKCQFNRPEVVFFGFKFSANGINLDTIKSAALREATKPNTSSELASFLGLAVWCSKFMVDFATVAAPLWDRVKSKEKWVWTTELDEAFERVKNAPLNALGYFNREWETILTVDASPVGIAGVLRQFNPKDPTERHIVALVSRALTDTEKRYSQIEKESLSLVWVPERLILFLIGRKFIFETDNLALKLILDNPSARPPIRLRRCALRLAPFDFVVKHRPGLGNMADYLSRHPVGPAEDSMERRRATRKCTCFTVNTTSLDARGYCARNS